MVGRAGITFNLVSFEAATMFRIDERQSDRRSLCANFRDSTCPDRQLINSHR
jgi:hypothetical protein